VDSVADGFVAFDSAKALIDRAVAAGAGQRSDVASTISRDTRPSVPVSASAPIPWCRN